MIVNAAGCGSGMREYGLLFAGEPEEDAARALAGAPVDVSAFLDELGLREPPAGAAAARRLPRRLPPGARPARARGAGALLQAAGHEVVIPETWELCCGSAGTYNVERPEIAGELGRRKAENLLATGADVVAAGNIGCLTQIGVHVRALGRELPVMHTVQVLDRAYQRGRGS